MTFPASTIFEWRTSLVGGVLGDKRLGCFQIRGALHCQGLHALQAAAGQAHQGSGRCQFQHAGHASLGWDDAGAIAVGRRADLVTLDTASPRTAGTGADEHTVVFAATGADVVQTVVDGRVVFRQGDREQVGRDLADAIGKVWAS